MNPYQLLDRPEAPLLGHVQPLKLVLERLNELHVCVIAPRCFGKTRLLRQVARLAPANGFTQCLAWDLKRHTPLTDEEFNQSLCGEMERQLEVPGEDLSAYFKGLGTGFESIRGVFQELDKAGQKILLALDGIEGVLQAGSVTKNVWDNLRDLAELSGVRFVTASRLPLRELCPPDSKTSPFWNIFHPTPVRFGAFQSGDWNDVFQPFAARKITVEESARKELINWSGGIPVLVMALCEQIFAGSSDGQTVSKPDIDAAAERVLDDFREHIETLWNDLPTECRMDVLELAKAREVTRAGRGADRVALLMHRGLATEGGGNKLKASCRLMERYAELQGQVLPELRKLFALAGDYEGNLPEVLQLRLGHISGFDAGAEQQLADMLKAIPNPETAKALIRGVSDRCLDLLLEREFPDGNIPKEFVEEWRSDHKLRTDDAKDREILNGKVPRQRGPRMKLLGLLHDENTGGTAKTRRSTFVLLNAVHAGGAFGAHAAEIGEAVPRGFVTAIASVAVELLQQVKQDTTLPAAS